MSLIAELKRRNVFRVGVAYAIVGWLLVEVASVVLPTFKAPEWVMQVCTFLVIFGFPFDPLRRQLERPGHDQGERKAHDHKNRDQRGGPVG